MLLLNRPDIFPAQKAVLAARRDPGDGNLSECLLA